ncbi:hypothetical protein D9757_011813 [Collybiopsis confluens]|uniref:F-box domain-containing protein n=1 Tax=Collybiopsis confluens TaxID=2823264 RepID=A0A8H5GGT0_9AGAR|nr:hypothetical protein D9757_011813 [Collybiopsis confluens]
MPPSECAQCGYSADDDIPQVPLGSARFQTLLSTNECLTDDEQRVFKTFVSNGQSKLFSLAVRIVVVENLLSQLMDAKEDLETALTERKKILHPMRSLPADVLVEIFKRGARIYDHSDRIFRSQWHSLDLSSPPWIYGQVCRRWRDISVNSPILWTRVKLSHWPEKMTASHEGLPPLHSSGLPTLAVYLGRSRSLPLMVYLDLVSKHLQYRAKRPGIVEYQAITAIPLSQSWRWELLHLRKSDYLNLDHGLISLNGLQSLKAITVQEGKKAGVGFIHDVTAPQLREWTSIGSLLVTSPAITTLSPSLCSNIQVYSISQASYREVLRIVHLLPNLRKLSVQELADEIVSSTDWQLAGSPVSLTKVPLNSLEELEIKSPATEGLLPFLDSISCPSLQSLQVRTGEIPTATIRAFQEHSNFRLKNWEFISPPFSVTNTLMETESIETIVVKDTSTLIQNLVLSELTVIAPDSNWNADDPSSLSNLPAEQEQVGLIPCPNLRRLELRLTPPQHSISFTNWDAMEQVYECVQSRMGAAAGFLSENVTISPSELLLEAPDYLAEGIRCHERLAELRSLGICVEIIGF